VSVDYNRDQGFLTGMGIDVADATKNGDEAATGTYDGGDYQIVCNEPTDGAEDGGRTAMENCLTKNSDINVVYTINEPAAVGAYNALKAAGKEDGILIVSVDGGCDGVQSVTDGVIGATSQQYPLKMASLGLAAIADIARGGDAPKTSAGLDFYNTGVSLVTDTPVDGVKSIDTTKGAQLCWG
jgi:fructose transport system substrate-binding protein